MQHCIYSLCRKLWENNGGYLWTTHDECVRKKRSIYDDAELEKLNIITEREIRNYVISGKYVKLYKGMEKEERNMLLQSNGSWTTFHGKKTKYSEREEKLCKHVEQNRLQGWVLNDPCTANIYCEVPFQDLALSSPPQRDSTLWIHEKRVSVCSMKALALAKEQDI